MIAYRIIYSVQVRKAKRFIDAKLLTSNLYMEQKTINQEVAALIRQTRKAKGLTQKELAGELGISVGTYNRYESELSNLSVETIEKVAQSMGLKARVIFE